MALRVVFLYPRVHEVNRNWGNRSLGCAWYKPQPASSPYSVQAVVMGGSSFGPQREPPVTSKIKGSQPGVVPKSWEKSAFQQMSALEVCFANWILQACIVQGWTKPQNQCFERWRGRATVWWHTRAHAYLSSQNWGDTGRSTGSQKSTWTAWWDPASKAKQNRTRQNTGTCWRGA